MRLANNLPIEKFSLDRFERNRALNNNRDPLISSETVDDHHKEAGEEGSGERVAARGETVRGGVRDDRLEATGGDYLVQGAEKTAETHQGERGTILFSSRDYNSIDRQLDR